MIRTAVDLFCGAAGGWTLGLAWAGVPVVAAVEINPWRAAQYAARWGVDPYPDVKTPELVNQLPYRPWLLCGSPPCTDASEINQRGRGVDGDQTGLFFDAVRIAGIIRPAWVLLENVPRLRSRGLDRVLTSLANIGYAPRVLGMGSWNAGKDHQRNRLWIVAPDASGGQGGAPGHTWEPPAHPTPGGPLHAGLVHRVGGLGRLGADALGRHLRAYDGVPAGVAEQARAAYGDGLDPIFPFILARALMQWEGETAWPL